MSINFGEYTLEELFDSEGRQIGIIERRWVTREELKRLYPDSAPVVDDACYHPLRKVVKYITADGKTVRHCMQCLMHWKHKTDAVEDGPEIEIIQRHAGREAYHVDCPCWKTGTYGTIEGCSFHPYDM